MTFPGVLSALVHFCAVEMRPFLLMYPALESGCFGIIKNQYLYHSKRDTIPGTTTALHQDCSISEATKEFDDLLYEAMQTLSWSFEKETRCAKVVYQGNNHGTFIYTVLR